LCCREARVNSVHHNSYCATHYEKNIAEMQSLFFLQYCVQCSQREWNTVPDIDMCIGEALVWMTPYFYCKGSHRIKEQPFVRAGVAILEGALLSGFHCIMKKHSTRVYDVTTPLHRKYQLDRATEQSARVPLMEAVGSTVFFYERFGAVYILWTGLSTCSRSVFCCVRSSWNGS